MPRHQMVANANEVLRFGLWLALGFVIYFAYSRHHSALATAKG